MATATETAAEDCEWCGESPWRFRCARCDPRKEKRLCVECARRWHSRGFSREHRLADRTGATRCLAEWLALLPGDAACIAVTSKMDAQKGVALKDPSVHVVNGTSSVEEAVPSEKTQETHEDSIVEETQASHDAEDDGAHVEYGNDGEDEMGADEEAEVPQEIPAQLSEQTQLDLEDVLNRLPSDDRAILDALADHIHDMIRLEDAVLCQRYTKCEAPKCQSILGHQRHVLDRKECAIPTCQSIASYMAHMEFCKSRTCPFCVRIQQRRLLGKKQALGHLVRNHRTQLQALQRESGDLARVIFMQDQIRALEQKMDRATEEVETLNRIVVNERLPIFNFPRFSWHITQEPIIKEEPKSAEDIVPSAQTEAVGPVDSTEPSGSTAEEGKEENERDIVLEGEAEARQPDDAVGEEVGDDPHTEATAEEDYVCTLIAKKDSGDTAAKAVFEESVGLACRIVDASFCSPGKASRCLLNCQKILLHLQHHVDLRVCKDKLCETVEQHFSHLSKCQNEGSDAVCEYCMRVSEREYARAVEVMEAEQPETDLKIQRLVFGITESLSNDPHDEREQNVMQLEDELQQAEDYKKGLTAKIEKARLNLVKARRRMKRHPMNPPSSHTTGLPLHWIKAARPSSPTSSSSRRRRS